MPNERDAERNGGREWSTTVAFSLMLAGPIIWGLAFLLVYGAHTLICVVDRSEEARQTASLFVALVAGVAFGALAVAAHVARRWRRRAIERDGDMSEPADFLIFTMIVLSSLSAIGVLWSGAGALVIEPCKVLR